MTLQPSAISRRDVLSMAGVLGVALAAPGFAQSSAAPLLTQVDLAVIAEIADIIVPATDTPGAKAAGVAEFARMMVSEWFVLAERQRFLSELHAFQQQATTQHGKAFLELSAREQQTLVGSVLESAERRAPASKEKPPFIVLVKRLTVLGYYTSEIGAAEELELNLVPGKYEPCARSGPDTHAGSTGFRNATFSAT